MAFRTFADGKKIFFLAGDVWLEEDQKMAEGSFQLFPSGFILKLIARMTRAHTNVLVMAITQQQLNDLKFIRAREIELFF